jgi:hypothetical protein
LKSRRNHQQQDNAQDYDQNDNPNVYLLVELHFCALLTIERNCGFTPLSPVIARLIITELGRLLLILPIPQSLVRTDGSVLF